MGRSRGNPWEHWETYGQTIGKPLGSIGKHRKTLGKSIGKHRNIIPGVSKVCCLEVFKYLRASNSFVTPGIEAFFSISKL